MRPVATAATDPGTVRGDNADGYVADDVHGIYAVADGSSGPPGELACRLMLQAVAERAGKLEKLALAAVSGAVDPSTGRRAVLDALSSLFQDVHADLLALVHERRELRGATTTATIALWDSRGVYIAHVGDCRLYLLHDRDLRQLTVDHTMVEDLVRMGHLRAEDAATHRLRGVVSRSVGESAHCKVDLGYVEVAPGDRLLLVSDGVSDYVDGDALWKLLWPGGSAHAFVADALKAGSADNVTAVVVNLPEPGVPATVISSVSEVLQHTERLDLLAGLSFCRHLRTDELMTVLRYVHEVQLLPGTTVFRQGDAGSDVYLVAKGTLAVEVDGQRVTTLGVGAHFGEIALVSGHPRSATIRAIEPARILRLSRDDFFDLSQRDQSVAVKILWSFAQTLAGRVTDLSTQLADWKSHGSPRAADTSRTMPMTAVPDPSLLGKKR